MSDIRQRVAGGVSPAKRQLEDEIHRTSPEARQQILRIVKITEETISPEDVLAMKANLSITWNKLRYQRRFVNQIIVVFHSA